VVGCSPAASILGERMDKIIEDKELITIGKFSLDVSNVSIYRKKISRLAWDQAVKDMNGNKDYDLTIFDNIVDVYGLYMIRQDLLVLKRRMPLLKAIWSFIARYFVTLKYIRKTNETEYNKFQEWAYFNITGTKKKELEAINQIQKMELAAIKEMENLNLDPEQLVPLLRTFLQETAGNMNTSAPLQKA